MKFSTTISFALFAVLATAAALPVAEPQTIGNGALGKDRIPCKGANCRPGANANPPTRGCNPIERCRGGPPAI
jgi:hypothetical protein